MTTVGAAHLYPIPYQWRPPAVVRSVVGFVHGRQHGVDVERFGVPYVFARYSETAPWAMWAGPFIDVGAAEQWIRKLGGTDGQENEDAQSTGHHDPQRAGIHPA